MKWISVKERLPEKNGIYLIYSAHDDEITTGYFNKENSNFYCHTLREIDNYNSHWMPLPDPPNKPH